MRDTCGKLVKLDSYTICLHRRLHELEPWVHRLSDKLIYRGVEEVEPKPPRCPVEVYTATYILSGEGVPALWVKALFSPDKKMIVLQPVASVNAAVKAFLHEVAHYTQFRMLECNTLLFHELIQIHASQVDRRAEEMANELWRMLSPGERRELTAIVERALREVQPLHRSWLQKQLTTHGGAKHG